MLRYSISKNSWYVDKNYSGVKDVLDPEVVNKFGTLLDKRHIKEATQYL